MQAFVIMLRGHEYSERVAARCIKAAKDIGGIDVERFDATRSKPTSGFGLGLWGIEVNGQQRYPAKVLISGVMGEGGEKKEGVTYVSLPPPSWLSRRRHRKTPCRTCCTWVMSLRLVLSRRAPSHQVLSHLVPFHPAPSHRTSLRRAPSHRALRGS